MPGWAEAKEGAVSDEDTAWRVAQNVIGAWTEILNDPAQPMVAALPTLKGLIAAAVTDALETVRLDALASALEDHDR